MTTTSLIRKLNAATEAGSWRTRVVDGERQIQRRIQDRNAPYDWFWSFQGWAGDARDVAHLAEDFGVA